MDLLKIKNTGDKPYTLHHDAKGHVTIPAHAEVILPAEYAFIHFGHPAAKNVGRQRDRDAQYDAARTMWGFYPGLMSESAWLGEGTDMEGNPIGPMCPAFECYDMQGDRVYMVLDDQDGTLGAAYTGQPTDAQSAAVSDAAMQAQLTRLEQQVADLTALLVASQTGTLLHPQPGATVAPEGHSGLDPAALKGTLAEQGFDPADPSTWTVDGDSSGLKDASVGAVHNAQSGEIPTAPENEAPVTDDAPKAAKTGTARKSTGGAIVG